MAFSLDDFQKVWASTSPLTPYEFSENNYQEGWNFIGGTPPSRQMWDYLQKLTDEKIKYIYNNMIPVGVVQAFAGATTPDGWLLCDGSAISRTDYANLYSVIGDTYGAGDGTSTFNLPDLIDKFVQGNAVAGTKHNAGLPNITGDVTIVSWRESQGHNGALDFTVGQQGSNGIADGVLYSPQGFGSVNIAFNASSSNAIYGASATVQPPSVTMRYIIKY